MKIGLTCLYSPRPLPHFLAYLNKILRQDGHQTHFLTCDAAFQTCYNHLFRGYPKLVECGICMLGGIRTFSFENCSSISAKITSGLSEEKAMALAYSNAVTLSREETKEGFRNAVVRKYQEQLSQAVKVAYANTFNWIEQNQLEAVLFYNGRMDVTAAVMEACKDQGVPFASVERTWAGRMSLIPNNHCLSPNALNSMAVTYRDKPLLPYQASLAAAYVTKRVRQKLSTAWRDYNVDAVNERWPIEKSKCKVLILPSSRNELEAFPELSSCKYADISLALPKIFKKLKIHSNDCVVRGHPIWATKFASEPISPADLFWKDYCKGHDIHYIGSSAKTSTQNLMFQADLIIINGGTAILEAGAFGKPIICAGRAKYENAGICTHIINETDFDNLEDVWNVKPAEVVRATLRFIYCYEWRFAQLVKYVRPLSAVEYKYYEGAGSDRIIRMLKEGVVAPDDALIGQDAAAEDEVIDLILKGNLELLDRDLWQSGSKELSIHRKPLFRWVDTVRGFFPKGDLL